ncbi:hypothetical protein Tco_0518919 [Tanacetum coccineum]
MAGSDDENPPPPPPQTPTQQAPHTVSTIKLPILKKGEYDIWAMKMEHYLSHTDYPIWEVIQKGNGPVSVSTDTNGVIKVLPPKTAEEILARERERKARTTLLMALPEDHLAKFHKMTDAKEMWDAIKSRFGGNDESKKMQKYILKQQFEGFSVSNSEGLHKGYDRFQSLLSQLEIHGAGVSTEDANQKFLRSLPSSWSQVSLVMRTKPGVESPYPCKYCFRTIGIHGRKSHLLEDKQIPSVWVFDEVFVALGWNLEEIHVTCAHLEKKRTRLRLYTKNHEELCIQSMETESPSKSDGVRIFIVTAS